MRHDPLARRLTVALALVFAVSLLPASSLDYPDTKKEDVVETLHGVDVADPYRWLEDDARESLKVSAWVAQENEVTDAYLASIPERSAIRERLTELWNYDRYSSPTRAGDWYYYSHNDGLQNQSVVYRVKTLDGEPEVVLDPNAWSDDGTVALATSSLSPDGRYLAYARSAAGSDWRTWFVRDLETGADLADRIDWSKYMGVSWSGDSRGFFYTQFPAPAEGEEFQAINEGMKVMYHRLGTPPSRDPVVYDDPDHPEYLYQPQASEDGRHLIIGVFPPGNPGGPVLYRDLTEPFSMPVELFGGFETSWGFIGNDGPLLYFTTDLDAPGQRIVAVDPANPGELREIVPQNEATLRGAGIVGNMIVAGYLRDAASWIRMYRLDGTHVRDVELPGLGVASGFDGKRGTFETFYSWSSFNAPSTVYRYDLMTGASELWRRPQVDFDPDDYVVKQVFYESKDGTRVPMFIAHRKGLKLDGERATLLYGYGGFNVAMTPDFSVTRLAWMEMGGVFAMPNLRGGGEYGREWHEAGKRLNKQNVFDDFIAAAEWLIDNDYTRPEKLAIFGGSNGGLLVGAAMTQRPDLFGAALPAVGVMDMLRFHLFTAGRYWVDDYGSPDDAEEFKALLAYSPYHNLKKGVEYPATMVTTADTDDRVVPGHSFKFAARLQEYHEGDEPVLIRIETSAGHGAGKPTTKRIEEASDMWSFLVRELRMKPDLPKKDG